MDSLQVFLVVLVDVYLPDYYQLPALPLGSLVELDLVAVLVLVAVAAVAVPHPTPRHVAAQRGSLDDSR